MAQIPSTRLPIVEDFEPEKDRVLSARYPTAEAEGQSKHELLCGEDAEVLLRNFNVQQAQNYFRMEKARVVIQCPACDRYNLLAAAVEKSIDGSIVTLPWRE